MTGLQRKKRWRTDDEGKERMERKKQGNKEERKEKRIQVDKCRKEDGRGKKTGEWNEGEEKMKAEK